MYKTIKKVLLVLLALVVLVLVIFLAGRYGWKLGGFGACHGAGITSVEVSENAVHITGFYPGSFPEGFCGCYSKEQDGKLYVGFRFSAVFGFFETGNFDITIPTKGDIKEIIFQERRYQEKPIFQGLQKLWNAVRCAGIYIECNTYAAGMQQRY